MVFNFPNIVIRKNKTFLGAALMAIMLVGFGGYVNCEKSTFGPVRQIDFLGFDIDSVKQTVAVPELKYVKTMALIDQLLTEDKLDVKLLERVRGKLVSWLICIPICKLLIREQTDVLTKSTAKDRLFWTRKQLAQSRIYEELNAWKQLSLMELSRPWREEKHSVFTYKNNKLQALYTDASQYALGAKLYDADNFVVDNKLMQPTSDSMIAERFFQYAIVDEDEPIHIKEMVTVLKAIVSLQDHIKNRHLSVYIDNMAVVHTFEGLGAKDLRLSRLLLQIVTWCHELNVRLNIQWIGTKLQLADGISRDLSLGECKLRPWMRELIVKFFRPTIDLFASAYNRLSPDIKFCSRYDELENEQTNGLSYVVSFSSSKSLKFQLPKISRR